jgi:hypothetical protein
MFRRVALTRTGVSEEPGASIIEVTRIGELGTLSVNSNRLPFCTININNITVVTINGRHVDLHASEQV